MDDNKFWIIFWAGFAILALVIIGSISFYQYNKERSDQIARLECIKAGNSWVGFDVGKNVCIKN